MKVLVISTSPRIKSNMLGRMEKKSIIIRK